MLPNFLLEEQVVRQDGAGPALELGPNVAEVVSFTLGVTSIIEQESLELSVWASTDGDNWGEKPIATFPQKFYCGVYTVNVDLTRHPETRYLRAQWKLNRWGRGEGTPMFGIYLFAAPLSAQVLRATA